jgi:uncharacterized glyoxalase superfamily protein PhnB
MLDRIAPELPASDLKMSIEFYGRKLGFRTAVVLPDHAYAIVERDSVAIHLFEDHTNKSIPIGVHIFTPDLGAVYAEISERGAVFSQQITKKPWGNREFRVLDPFGNELKFSESRAEE